MDGTGYDDYGNSFWEEVLESSSEPTLGTQVGSGAEQHTGQVDILQQSLQAANILDGHSDITSTQDCINDFDFTFNDDSFNNNSLTNYPLQTPQPSRSEQISTSVQANPDFGNANASFHVDDFLNIPTSGSNTSGTQPKLKKPVNSQNGNTYTVNSAQALPGGNATRTQTNMILPVTQVSNKVLQPVSRTMMSNPNTITGHGTPLANVQVQVCSNQPVLLAPATRIATPSNNTYYIISGSQSVAQYNNASYTVCTSTTSQSSTVSACRSTFTHTISQPLSVPIVLTVNPGNNMASNTPVSVVNVARNQTPPSVPLQQPNSSSSNFEEEARKLAAVLQTKARQSGSGGNTAILKVGNQEINITDPAVAKALAIKLLLQKLKQRSPMLQPVPAQSGIRLQTSSVANVQNVSIASASVQQQPQTVKTQYVYTALPVAGTVKTEQQQHRFVNLNTSRTASPHVSTSTIIPATKSPVVQIALTKSNSPVQFGRYEIASVNIPITSTQNGTVNSSTHRSGTPVRVNPAINQGIQVVSSSVQPRVLSSSVVGLPAASSSIVHYRSTASSPGLQQRHGQNTSFAPKVLIEHHAQPAAKASNLNPTQQGNTSNSTVIVKPPQIAQNAKPSVVKLATYRVDPNLTLQQVQQVQQVIAAKMLQSKNLPLTNEQRRLFTMQLTTEQKQLLAAFRAQLCTMEEPVQQYYLRNPQLFLQKVYQHLQSGKPYVFQTTSNHLNLPKRVLTLAPTASTQSTSNTQHPTITLTQDNLKVKSVVPSVRVATPVQNQRKTLKRPAVDKMSSLPAVQPFPVQTKRPSLLLEQLQKHRELAESPDPVAPFKTVREACRRLLPFHVYNSPQIADKHFVEAEPLFDKISEAVSTKMNKMLEKYHLLCLKDASREFCSADAVMLERTYLHQEKAAFSEMKQKIKDHPYAVVSYLPTSVINNHPDLTSYVEEQSKPKENPILLELISQNVRRPSSQSVLSASSGSGSLVNVQFHKQNDQEPVASEKERDMLLKEAVESILS